MSAEQSVPVVKRTRKPKKVADFTILPTKGILTEIKILNSMRHNSSMRNESAHYSLSPYTNYIPLSYLYQEKITTSHIFSNSIDRIVTFMRRNVADNSLLLENLTEFFRESSPLKSMVLSHLYEGHNYDYLAEDGFFKSQIKEYLSEDRFMFLENFLAGTINVLNIKEHLTQRICSVRTPSFSSFVGHFSAYLAHEGVMTPQVVAVIHPEDLVYQRMHYLMKNSFDMTKVFFLVNKELDSTSFINTNFRIMYKKHILPELMKYDTNIFKVDASYIFENCFHHPLKLSNNIIERKKEMETLIRTFKGESVSLQEDSVPGVGSESFAVTIPDLSFGDSVAGDLLRTITSASSSGISSISSGSISREGVARNLADLLESPTHATYNTNAFNMDMIRERISELRQSSVTDDYWFPTERVGLDYASPESSGRSIFSQELIQQLTSYSNSRVL